MLILINCNCDCDCHGYCDFNRHSKMTAAHQPSPPSFIESAREVTVPLAVVLQRSLRANQKWAMPHWQVAEIIAGEHIRQDAEPSGAPIMIHDDGGLRRYLCGGLTLHLYKDGGEGYWVNLLARAPHLFVVCDGEQGDERIAAAFVTANQDEANGYMESDRLVLSAPMPDGLCDIVERYVISHYRPQEKKKRTRREWAQESIYAKRNRQSKTR